MVVDPLDPANRITSCMSELESLLGKLMSAGRVGEDLQATASVDAAFETLQTHLVEGRDPQDALNQLDREARRLLTQLGERIHGTIRDLADTLRPPDAENGTA